MTNSRDLVNYITAILVMMLYFGLIVYAMVYIKKNKNNLYTIELNEPIDGIPL